MVTYHMTQAFLRRKSASSVRRLFQYVCGCVFRTIYSERSLNCYRRMEESDPGQLSLDNRPVSVVIWLTCSIVIFGVLMTILKIYDIIMGTNYVQYPPVINTIGNVTNTGATTDDDYDDDACDFNKKYSEDGNQRTSSVWPQVSYSSYNKGAPMDYIKKGDITVHNSNSELCFGQPFGVSDEGYNSMMQIEAVEQKTQHYKDELKEMCNNHLLVLDEKQKYMLDYLEEEHEKKLAKQRKIWEEELKMKVNHQKRITILEEEFKLDEERRRLRGLMDAKLEEHKRELIAKREVQVIDLKRKYGLSDKQKRKVDTILKKLNNKIAIREKKYEKEVKNIQKKKRLDIEQRLQFEKEKKLYKINKAKRECNEKLQKQEASWTKKWIVRVESMQKSRSNNSSIPTSCSINNSNTSMQQQRQQQ
ncbi:uncharacterized protein [Dysidea avara]|uniref:uncharacterized protein n=1 Tax=Dysidea avara TaxID=196820 RepID=UPI00332C9316